MSDVLHKFCREYMRVQPTVPIRFSQLSVLNILCSTPGPHTPMMLAKVLGVSRPMIASHLSALQVAGLVVRMTSPDDGRSMYILPTKKGKTLFEKTNRDMEKINSNLAKKMGQKNFQTLLKLVSQAIDVLSDAQA